MANERFYSTKYSYRVTLKAIEDQTDPDERERLLSACHQRCADRYLPISPPSISII